MDDRNKRQHSILYPSVINKNQNQTLVTTTTGATQGGTNTLNSNPITKPQPPKKPQGLKNLAYPPSYEFIPGGNPPNNLPNRTTSNIPMSPDGYVFVKGYPGGGGAAAVTADQIPRNMPTYFPKRMCSTTNNNTQTQQPLGQLPPPYLHQTQPPLVINGTGSSMDVSNLEIFNTLNPRKAPNMNYKEKILNWMATIPQFNNSENNEIYIDCYPGVISTSVTPTGSDDEIDLADIEDILELQAQKVTRYVTRLYFHEDDNWDDISNDSPDRQHTRGGDCLVSVNREMDTNEDEVEEDEDEDDEDGVGYGYRDIDLPVAFETD
ncbi:hypothetical protein G210_1211 [Candida maltosa Xu316]|uniref:Uncharacterized protein n=1 Tax=Candida maltosa (strain Xu316) TaxID=1245528 RepID=M3IP89_CANMX|nr:hypothetical protein G210_1211 [Candida maltosa Xu316]